ncbi:hypothetical protein D5086_020294 [Populus alba]|uniref:Uncharacterized protein n=1 Tax=Populus alba TaxID=43335 RepID=A0ACC4BJR1_POPAL
MVPMAAGVCKLLLLHRRPGGLELVHKKKNTSLNHPRLSSNVYRSQPDHRIPGGTMSPSSPSVASWGVGVDDTVLHSLATTGNGRDCTTVLGGFSRGNCIPG